MSVQWRTGGAAFRQTIGEAGGEVIGLVALGGGAPDGAGDGADYAWWRRGGTAHGIAGSAHPLRMSRRSSLKAIMSRQGTLIRQPSQIPAAQHAAYCLRAWPCLLFGLSRASVLGRAKSWLRPSCLPRELPLA